MTKRVRVTLNGIKVNTEGSDPGANLEIYGDLFARRVFVNQEIGEFQEIAREHLWHRNESDRVDISAGAIFVTPGVVRDMIIEPGEFLWLGGHLAEHDTFGENDNLGFIDKKIPHDAIQSGPQAVVFRESDQEAQVNFTLTVL